MSSTADVIPVASPADDPTNHHTRQVAGFILDKENTIVGLRWFPERTGRISWNHVMSTTMCVYNNGFDTESGILKYEVCPAQSVKHQSDTDCI
jgi:hypothetical protein